jgi:hypothetical protein
LVGMKNMFLWLYFLDHYLDIARIWGRVRVTQPKTSFYSYS